MVVIAGAYALVRTLQIVETWRAGRYIPRARPLTRHFVLWSVVISDFIHGRRAGVIA